MKVKDLIQQLLLQNQEQDVMFQDPNARGGPFSIERVSVEVADEDEYPEDYNMPEGYTFVLLQA